MKWAVRITTMPITENAITTGITTGSLPYGTGNL